MSKEMKRNWIIIAVAVATIIVAIVLLAAVWHSDLIFFQKTGFTSMICLVEGRILSFIGKRISISESSEK